MNPRDYFFWYWIIISFVTAEYLSFYLSPGNTTELDTIITLLFGLPLMMVTFLPVAIVLAAIWLALGWLDD